MFDCSNFDFVCFAVCLTSTYRCSLFRSFESNVISSCRKAKPLLLPTSHAELGISQRCRVDGRDRGLWFFYCTMTLDMKTLLNSISRNVETVEDFCVR